MEENEDAEGLMHSTREEGVALSDYQDYYDTYQQIGQFLKDIYMLKRMHSSLNYLIPTELDEQWLMALKVDSNVHQ